MYVRREAEKKHNDGEGEVGVRANDANQEEEEEDALMVSPHIHKSPLISLFFCFAHI